MQVNRFILFDAIQLFFKIEANQNWCRKQYDSQIGPLVYDSRFDPQTFKTRVLNYAAQSFITNTWFSTLHGKKSGNSHKKRAFLTAVLTPYIDDLMDEEMLDATVILNKVLVPSSNDPLSGWIAKQLKSEFMDNPKWEKAFLEVMDSQRQSTLQLHGDELTQDELLRITRNKGGKATLFYRMILPYPCSQAEFSFIMELGFLLQLINDIFDVYKDSRAGIVTIASKYGPEKTHRIYSGSLERLIDLYDQLKFDQSSKNAAWRKIMLVIARGAVCLDMQIQISKNVEWNPEKYTRSQLICDMEHPGNIFKNLKYAALYSTNFSSDKHHVSL